MGTLLEIGLLVIGAIYLVGCLNFFVSFPILDKNSRARSQIPNGVKLAISTLHFMAIFHFLLGLIAAYLSFISFVSRSSDFSQLGWTCLGIGIFFMIWVVIDEAIVWGLKNMRYWAWVLGAIAYILFFPTLFFSIPCALGLFGLMNPETKAAFQAALLQQREK
jgi:hypothetical protein